MRKVKTTKVLRSEIVAFLDQKIADVLAQAFEDELDSVYDTRADLFIHDDPVSTHVSRAMLMGEEKRIADILEFLQGDKNAITLLLEGNGIEIIEDLDEEEENERDD